ncbi:MAG: F0F1 ATP synthase subunit gamma [Alphaproteobacteria bacterium]|nr:F0F1 ATP synthase subunit gamma [Alphaproteobacteria bacterium]
MPSLKDLKNRIKSVKSTQKITKAMKMVAASKLRRAREAAEAARPYAMAMDRMVSRLAASYQHQSNGPLLLKGTGSDKNHLIIVATADRGLCGAFNSSITRATRKQVKELQAQGKNVKLYCVGKKSRDLLQNDFGKLIVGVKTDIAKKTVAYTVAEAIAEDVLEIFEREKIDVVSIYYNHFKSVISQIVTHQQLIPLAIETSSQSSDASYDYEPEEEAILADLLPRNFAMQIFKALLENAASEQGARMNAMENATKNAGEMIKKITLKYNRTRQANITKELIEIISGAEAV